MVVTARNAEVDAPGEGHAHFRRDDRDQGFGVERLDVAQVAEAIVARSRAGRAGVVRLDHFGIDLVFRDIATERNLEIASGQGEQRARYPQIILLNDLARALIIGAVHELGQHRRRCPVGRAGIPHVDRIGRRQRYICHQHIGVGDRRLRRTAVGIGRAVEGEQEAALADRAGNRGLGGVDARHHEAGHVPLLAELIFGVEIAVEGLAEAGRTGTVRGKDHWHRSGSSAGARSIRQGWCRTD